MNPFLKHIYIISGLVLAVLFIYKLDFKTEIHNHFHATPVDSVAKIKPMDPKPNIEPENKLIQKKSNKEARKKAEQEPIILGFKEKPGELDIQKIDTAGVITEEKFKPEEDSEIIATNKGVEEKKKTKAGKLIRKAWKGIKTGLAVVGAVAVIIIATK